MKIRELNNHRDLVLFVRDLNDELNFIKDNDQPVEYVDATAYSVFKVFMPHNGYTVTHINNVFTTEAFAESSYYCVKMARKLIAKFREEENDRMD